MRDLDNPENRCPEHGSPITFDEGGRTVCLTENLLDILLGERAAQFARYGTNNDCEDGTGPDVRWIPSIPAPHTPLAAVQIEGIFRREYEKTEAAGETVSWMQLVREEVAEAFAEEDPERLAEELMQVAALCVSWVETISEREFRKDLASGIVT